MNALAAARWIAPVLPLLAACASAPPADAPADVSTCVVTDQAAVDSLTLAVSGAVRSRNAPVPRNAAEQFVFAQIYETLLRVDCTGRVVPAVAAAWSSDGAGRHWEFTLRDGAAFDDGTSVTPADVVEGWSFSRALVAGDVDGYSAVDIVRTTVIGRRLRVELTAGVDAAWFARPELSVVRASGAWPGGTGVYAVRADTVPGALHLAAREPRRQLPRSITVRVVRNGDERSALDTGTDLLVTSDPATLAYARALAAYTAVPAGWTVSHVLASRQAPIDRDSMIATGVARDLVVAETRLAEPLQRHSVVECGAAAVPPPLPARAVPVIAYPRDDAIARAIAERVVALAWPAARAPDWLTLLLDTPMTTLPVAEGMSSERLADALRTGALLAAVLPVPRTPVSCAALSLSAAPTAAALLRSGWHATPLLDSSRHVVHRRPPGRLLLDAAGTLRFESGIP